MKSNENHSNRYFWIPIFSINMIHFFIFISEHYSHSYPQCIPKIPNINLNLALSINWPINPQAFFKNVLLFFGDRSTKQISRGQFHYFLDCLFRGLGKVMIPCAFEGFEMNNISMNDTMLDRSSFFNEFQGPSKGQLLRLKSSGRIFYILGFDHLYFRTVRNV